MFLPVAKKKTTVVFALGLIFPFPWWFENVSLLSHEVSNFHASWSKRDAYQQEHFRPFYMLAYARSSSILETAKVVISVQTKGR